jgi:hypothetical protein
VYTVALTESFAVSATLVLISASDNILDGMARQHHQL